MTTKKNIRWLTSQLPKWIEDKIVDESQAKNILNQYEQIDSINLGRLIFSAIGALMIGLGIILFFAYNWQEMHRFVKLAVIFSFVIAANAGAIWFDSPSRKNRAASEGLAILGTMLFGGAIWLISQIYHIDEHYPNAFWLWGSAAVAMGWARKSSVQCLAGIVLLSVWGGFEILDYQQVFHFSPWWILFGTTTLAWHMKSRGLLFISIVSFLFLWFFSAIKPLDETLAYFILAMSIVIAQIGINLERVKNTWREFRFAIAMPGFFIYLCAVYALTFTDLWGTKRFFEAYQNSMQASYFWIAFFIGLLVPIFSLLPLMIWKNSTATDKAHAGLMLFVLCLAFGVGPGHIDFSRWFLALIMNLVFLAHCSMFILHGSHQQRGWEVSIGCFGFALLVFTRYTDLFESLLSRSLVFVILGASIFLVGNFYSKQKKLPPKIVNEDSGAAE